MSALSVGYFVWYRDAKFFLPVLKLLHYPHVEAEETIFGVEFQRMATPWVHPNLAGGMLVLLLPLAFFYALLRKSWQRALGVSTAVLAMAGLIFTGSRGAIVSLAITLLLLAWRRTPYTVNIVAVAVVAAIALVLWYPPLQKRLSMTFSSTNASTETRMDEYRHFPDAVEQFPLGIGFKVDPPPPHTSLRGISNLWLNYVYKIGAIGMFLFGMVMLSWWRQTRPSGRLDHIGPQHAIWLGTGYGVVAALLTGFFDHYFSFTQVAIAVFWLMVGLSLGAVRERLAARDPLLHAASHPNRIGSNPP
jgi:hypothetical protein